MKKLLFILVAFSFVMGGCANYRNIEVTDADIVNLSVVSLNAAQVKVKLEVNNPTKATFEIVGVDGSIKRGGDEFATVMQVQTLQKCTILPGMPSKAEITLKAELTDPFSIFAGGVKLEQFTADVTIKIKQGVFTKRLVLKDIPAGELIKEIKF